MSGLLRLRAKLVLTLLGVLERPKLPVMFTPLRACFKARMCSLVNLRFLLKRLLRCRRVCRHVRPTFVQGRFGVVRVLRCLLGLLGLLVARMLRLRVFVL